jgi:hypothetical protein
MQQQKNSHLQSSSEALLERDRQIIQIEDTPAFRRNKQRVEVSKHTKMRSVLASAIGDDRIGSKLGQGGYLKDSGSDYLSEVDRVSTGKIDLVKILWHGAFELEQSPSSTHYLIYVVLAGSIVQKVGDPHSAQQDRLCCSPEIATTIDLGQKLVSSFSEQGEVLLISLDRDSIDLALSKLIDSPKEQLSRRFTSSKG